MMKRATIFLLMLFCGMTHAQRPCDYSTNVVDSLGTYKSTVEYLVHEKVFGGTTGQLYFSLIESDGLLTLNTQFITKSTDFIKAYCLDKNSRIYLQLDNGKIVTLMHIDQENCGTTVVDDKGRNNRILSGYFLFRTDSYAELKKSPISLVRIKFMSETVDYVFKENLKSELDGKSYSPSTYFLDSLHCIDN